METWETDTRLPVDGRARWATIGLAIVILIDLIAIGSHAMQIDLLHAFEATGYNELAATTNDARQQGIGVAYLVGFIIAGIAFVMWFHRAYRNISTFDAVPERNASWTFWGFVVPIISFYMPYRMMRETCTASAPTADPRLGLVGGWWALYLFSIAADKVVEKIFESSDTLAGLVTATWLNVGAVGIDIAAAVMAIVVVRTLTEWQTDATQSMSSVVEVFD